MGCNHEGCVGLPIPPCVNLFVKVTDGCNAHCAFCSNANAPATTGFDIEKLFTVIDEVLTQGIILNRINITGGDPSCVSSRVEQILHRLDGGDYQHIHVHLNTNGLLLQSQELMKQPRWDSISVSLHHYDARKLSEIYQTEITSESLLFDGVDMMKVNASCNLIKGYIDNTLKFQACDLLARNLYTTNSIDAQGRTESFATTIPRYFLFSLTWRFNKVANRK